ncbi:heme lyase CcmF/NrfE family subunit [Vibrio sp. SCSIO 43135]|uniref:heme lyase CcmF/NrfE family subunit n=1 Tax=Vibrio sp. SCSIO 43135 TaxID=2819096 RepID=UPI002075BBE5|nr:heme lyase CcmF/NrfE family subunit [Vibrio sp. SCSIO 43135]USD40399.1 heme lyase CcmF/NrfE family subunit [Vibrio sp. SCSIO 43135]
MLAGELGLVALIAVVVLSTMASAQYVLPRWASERFVQTGKDGQSSANSKHYLLPVTRVNGLLSLLSLGLLATAFLTDQFQLQYVAEHSNSKLPVFFKFAAVWGGHQGSMLFWVMTLSGWAALYSLSRRCPSQYKADVLWVMNLLVAAFAWFTLLASNPFEFSPQFMAEGRDLNPMLQDVGLIFHPPLLYLGYIGYSMVFAFACAALMQEKVTLDWLPLCRQWALVAWVFLTGGIVLGSWWAYYELGWGGWWFWDPVENASLLPWLTGTALLHALLAAQRQKMLLNWVMILAFITFSLSILGTFIVRSGVLTSVHAFAVDPGKGISLLLILVVMLISSFGLLIFRGDKLTSEPLVSVFSRSYLVLVAIGLLLIATFTVFLGTFYPMVYELLGLGSISVGAPYFNTLITPLSLLALVGMGAGSLVKWRKGGYCRWQQVVWLGLVAIVSGLLGYLFQLKVFNLEMTPASVERVEQFDALVCAVWILACGVVVTHLWAGFKANDGKKLIGVTLAHVGVAVACVGAAMNAEHSYEVNRKLAPNKTFEFVDWQVHYQETQWRIGPNYTAERASIHFEQQGSESFSLFPERRHYPVRVMNMSEPAIKIFWHGDYYVTLGEKVDSQSYAVKVQYKAAIRWVWFGALLGMLGGVSVVILRLKQESGVYEQVEST